MTKFRVIRLSLMLGKFYSFAFIFGSIFVKVWGFYRNSQLTFFLMWISGCYSMVHWNECFPQAQLPLPHKVSECASKDIFLVLLLCSTEFLHVPFLALKALITAGFGESWIERVSSTWFFLSVLLAVLNPLCLHWTLEPVCLLLRQKQESSLGTLETVMLSYRFP